MQLRSMAAGGLEGSIRVPGDKSLSHRALMFAAMTVGETRIEGLLEGEDVMATADALRCLGVDVMRDDQGFWRVQGVGVSGLAEPEGVLDLGNAGTGVRLLMGLLAGHPFTTFLSGDASLRRRPMGRVTKPLAEMGAACLARSGDRLPLAMTGSDELIPIVYEQPVASAQVKSAILLAGLHAPGETTVIEPSPSRDHTERMLNFLGAEVETEALADGRSKVSITGHPELMARDLSVPGDPSSAAFLLAAAALCPGSKLRIENVGMNTLRTGFLSCLEEMGAKLTRGNGELVAGEPVSWLEIEHGPLEGIDVPASRVPSMIDEFPILAAAASIANGKTRMTGLGELRVKESDRLKAMADGLAAAGVQVDMGPDSLIVDGRGEPPSGGCLIDADHDHRIAMSFLVLGCTTKMPIEVSGAQTIETSFPGFRNLMNELGADIQETNEDEAGSPKDLPSP